MAFLPQFVRPELGHAPAQILILGFLVNLVGVVIESEVSRFLKEVMLRVKQECCIRM
jgi:threonine/homoserine/homoserine lactone efflux protein